MPTARYSPAPSTMELELTPKPPSSCLLALTTYQHHSERGHHFPRVTQQIHGPAARFSVGGGLSPRPLHCHTWLPSPLVYSPRAFLGQARFARLWGFSWVWVRIPLTSQPVSSSMKWSHHTAGRIHLGVKGLLRTSQVPENVGGWARQTEALRL